MSGSCLAGRTRNTFRPTWVCSAKSSRTGLFHLLPDLRQRFEREHEITGAHAHILVYERRDRASARLSPS